MRRNLKIFCQPKLKIHVEVLEILFRSKYFYFFYNLIYDFKWRFYKNREKMKINLVLVSNFDLLPINMKLYCRTSSCWARARSNYFWFEIFGLRFHFSGLWYLVAWNRDFHKGIPVLHRELPMRKYQKAMKSKIRQKKSPK